ncbi:MAG: hypothetical protein GY851_02610 [bacterium]|nr:hypothetical protein [bacterium]
MVTRLRVWMVVVILSLVLCVGDAAAAPLRGYVSVRFTVSNIGTVVTGRIDGKTIFVVTGYHEWQGRRVPVLEAVGMDGKVLWQHEATRTAKSFGEYIQWLEAPDMPEPLILWACDGDDEEGGLFRARDGKKVYPFEGGSNNASMLADLDGDGRTELIRTGQRYVSCLDMATLKPRWTHRDAVLFCWSYPAVADLTGDGLLDITWGSEYNQTESDTSTLMAVDHRDKALWRIDNIREDVGSTPVFVADVDGDGEVEIVKNGLDLEGRNLLETNHIYIYRKDGSILRRIPSQMYSIGLADLTGDGTLEAFGVVSTRDGGRSAIDKQQARCVNLHTGQELWRTELPRVGLPGGNALAADCNGDGKLEVILCDGNPMYFGRMPGGTWGMVCVLSHKGDLMQHVWFPSWARRIAMCDINNDGRNELIVHVEGEPGWVRTFRTSAPATTKTWHLPFGNRVNWGAEHLKPEK